MNKKFAVLDCETTGLHDTARIIQFAVVYLDLSLQIEEEFSSYLFGDGTVGSAETFAVHGISEMKIRDAPSFSEVLPKFEFQLRQRLVFAHFAPFDKARVDYELSLIGKPPLSAVGCTKGLGEFLGYGVLRLAEATKLFGIDPGNPHDALSDARSAANVLRNYFLRHPASSSQYLKTLESH